MATAPLLACSAGRALPLDVSWSEERYRQYKLPYKVHPTGPRFAVDSTYFDRNYFNIISRCADRLPKAADRLQAIEGAHFRQLDDYFKSTELAEIRPLFEHATGINTFDSSELLLLIIGAQPHLMYRKRTYPIERHSIGKVRNPADPTADVTQETVEWIKSLPGVFRQMHDKFG